MTLIVEKALDQWGWGGATWRLAAARENRVYKIKTATASYALRLHRVGYRTDAELISELQWLRAVADGGLEVPGPCPSADGMYFHAIDGVQVDAVTWLEGQTMLDLWPHSGTDDRCRMLEELGRQLAVLHQISDAWQPPEGFQRWAWDRPGLLGEQPVWDRFWDNPTLTAGDRSLFIEARRVADAHLARLESTLDHGLIHADPILDNVLVDDGAVKLIDFDDGGYGFRLFDLATVLTKLVEEPDYTDLQSALIAGYTSRRSINLAAFDLIMALRSLTYVGWIIKRLREPGGQERNVRGKRVARALVEQYLAG